jgi:hypothetical protein
MRFSASTRLADIDHGAYRLSSASSALEWLPGVVRELDQASDKLAYAASSATPNDWSWNAFRWGMGVAAAVVAVILGLFAYVLHR